MSAREAAFRALAACRKSGAWSELALDAEIKRGELDRRDAAFATRLCMGVLQNTYLLDWHIFRFSSIKPNKLQPQVLDILRTASYQIIFMDRVPASAAVDEAVKLTRKYANAKAAGFVNAVLRKLAAEQKHLPEFESADAAETLSVRYSHPLWFCKRLISSYGYDAAEKILAANNQIPPTTVQFNTILGNSSAILDEIRTEFESASPHLKMLDCLEISGTGRIEGSKSYQRGLFYVQDAAAKAAVLAAEPMPGDTVIDACAAPGGKSFAAAICMKNTGRIISCDIHENKLRKISAGAERLGIEIIETRAFDARTFDPALSECAELVITDVPCSGFGVIRKKPEIRYKNAGEIAGLPDIQLDILKNQSRYVKRGGVLLYSTCTVLREENEDVVSRFLAENDAFVPEEFQTVFGASKNGHLTLLPGIHGTDGFFICKLRRKT